jgi:hypothetical protein
MTATEIINERIELRKLRNQHHRATLIAIHGSCTPFTQSEYNKVQVKQKSVFRKGKTHAFRNLWNHNNITLQ